MRESHVQFGRKAVALQPLHRARGPGRRAFIAVSALGGCLALWSAAATAYILFKDDLAAGLIRRQVDQQHAYEHRISGLRMQVDRMVGRQLLDQDSVEAQVAELLSRQSAIENRHALIARLAEDIGATPKVAPGETVARPAVAPSDTISPGLAYTSAKPTPIIEFPFAGERRPGAAPARPGPSAGSPKAPPERVSGLKRSLERMADTQVHALRGLEEQAARAATRLRAALAEIGLESTKVAAGPAAPMGGPLVPLDADADEDEFGRAADRVRATARSIVALRRIAAAAPVRRPLGGAEMTSGFGSRHDPFTRGLALHTGIDFKAAVGAPVKATGAGIVIAAETRGGYGKLVEIDHGHGLTTRYAHLSAIAVEEGQHIAAGATIGLVGSTGRSTGPHLHYETRIRGEAADPAHFLAVGRRHNGVF